MDEFVRLLSPVASLGRIATTDTEVGGCPVKAGEHLLLRFDSANRDDAKFPNGETLQFDPPRTGTAGFGLGIHRGIGMPLARVQIAIAMAELLARITNLQLAVPAKEITRAPGIANCRMPCPCASTDPGIRLPKRPVVLRLGRCDVPLMSGPTGFLAQRRLAGLGAFSRRTGRRPGRMSPYGVHPEGAIGPWRAVAADFAQRGGALWLSRSVEALTVTDDRVDGARIRRGEKTVAVGIRLSVSNAGPLATAELCPPAALPAVHPDRQPVERRGWGPGLDRRRAERLRGVRAPGRRRDPAHHPDHGRQSRVTTAPA
jgi:hypothetical protein